MIYQYARNITATLMIMSSAAAQDIERRQIDLVQGDLQLVERSITGNEIVDYIIAADAGQILSVDLQSSSTSAAFNISPDGGREALFSGMTSGPVADVPAPWTGTYVVRVFLARPAARRGETAEFVLGLGLGASEFADGLSGGPDFWAVNVQEGGALNLRAGPATRYAIVSPLRRGNILQNRGCRLTGKIRWCQVRVTGSGTTGWAAGQYLVESAAPAVPTVPEGGPIGNGMQFDATGFVACTLSNEQRQCPFGVIRSGPGNAGVWIALRDGTERQFLFEGGRVVATSPADAFSVEIDGDLMTISVRQQLFEIPSAIVFGG